MESGLLMFYKSDTSIEGQARTANVEELLNSVKAYIEERHNELFEEMQADGEVAEGVELTAADLPVVTLGDYLENVSLLSAVDVEEDENGSNKIALMTVHSVFTLPAKCADMTRHPISRRTRRPYAAATASSS
jgi:superfamily I DNA/RNA helicase